MKGTVIEAVRLELVEMEKAGAIDARTLGDSLRYLRDNEDEVATWHANGMRISEVAEAVVEVARA